MTYDDLLVETAGNAGTITINRPERRNALRPHTLREMADALDRLGDDDDVRVVVITGSGDRAFCGGGDLNQVGGGEREPATAGTRALLRWVTAFRQCPKPVIAKVTGYCLGLGNELNLLCDLTIADDTAQFGQAGPRVGSVPLVGGTQLLPSVCGLKRAKEVLMLCRRYSGEEAVRVGLANAVVPRDELDAEVARWVDELSTMSPQSLRMSKLALSYLFDVQWPSVQAGLELTGWMVDSAEMQEGATAFLQKRAPEFGDARRRRAVAVAAAARSLSPSGIVARHMEAMLAGDLDAAMLGFDDASRIVSDGEEHVGRAAIRERLAAALVAAVPDTTVEYDVVAGTDGRVALRWRVGPADGGAPLAIGTDYFTVADGLIRLQEIVHDQEDDRSASGAAR